MDLLSVGKYKIVLERSYAFVNIHQILVPRSSA